MFKFKLTKGNKKLLKITIILLLLETGIGFILYYFSDILFPNNKLINNNKESFESHESSSNGSTNDSEKTNPEKLESEEKPRGKLGLHYCHSFETEEECLHDHSNGTKHGCVYDKPSGKCFAISNVV